MNTYETYVSLEVARLLKQAGFDWETRASYWFDYTISQNYILTYPKTHDDWNHRVEEDIDYISAPTLQIAQRWLREVKNMSVEISFEKPGKWSCCVILDTNKEVSFENLWREEFDYDTYESALEAGINKCLKIILEEKE